MDKKWLVIAYQECSVFSPDVNMTWEAEHCCAFYYFCSRIQHPEHIPYIFLQLGGKHCYVK